ncbi:MAG: Methylase involved in ubiquinone/menaquinone biosynthesis [Rhodobacteraceae bacterium HLUCCA08]|nr:MAG: Methylase involved in ubiquinone/menaquinone biosynthesis [Rhodobacteraceae bacterium HLUCCA08]
MSADPRTIAAYDARAQDYAERFGTEDAPGASLRRFADALPPGGHVLDLGCGPGTSAARLMAMGFALDALDASAEMVRLARARSVPARQAGFDDLDASAAYDGVWANFSLLHAPRADLPGHLAAIARALKSGGLLHIGMKLGTGQARDRLDRRYTYVARDELAELLVRAGFTLLCEHHFEEAGLAGTIDPGIVILARHG